MKKYQILLLWFSVSIVLFLLFLGSIYLVDNPEIHGEESTTWVAMGVNFITVLILVAFNYWVVEYISWPRNFYFKVPFDFLLGIALIHVVDEVYLSFSPIEFYFWACSIFTELLVFLIIQVYHYVKEYNNTLKRLTEERTLSLQYRYSSLIANINPHFLFNSLSVLLSLIDGDDKKRAHNFTLAISRIYRYMMAQHDNYDVDLEDEIEFAKNYSLVFSDMYDGAFTIKISGVENMESKRIIRYSLELLIENIIKHNVISAANPMIVDIDIMENQMTVTNPIIPKQTNAHDSSHLGLTYLEELYKRYDKKFEMTIIDGRFIAKVPFINARRIVPMKG